MKKNVICKILLALCVLLLFSCAEGDDFEKTTTKIFVSESWSPDKNEVDLSRSVTLPLNKEDAELIKKECGCVCAGELKLVDDEWVLNCCSEYPDCDVHINVNTGEVTCNHLG